MLANAWEGRSYVVREGIPRCFMLQRIFIHVLSPIRREINCLPWRLSGKRIFFEEAHHMADLIYRGEMFIDLLTPPSCIGMLIQTPQNAYHVPFL